MICLVTLVFGCIMRATRPHGFRKCCRLPPPGRPSGGGGPQCRWPGCLVRRAAAFVRAGEVCTSTTLRLSVARSMPRACGCCASLTTAFGVATVLPNVATCATTCAIRAHWVVVYNPPRLPELHWCFRRLHCAAHVATGWRPHPLTCCVMCGPMTVPWAVHNRAAK